MITVNQLDYPAHKKGWRIEGSVALSSGTKDITIKSGDYTEKISGMSLALKGAYGFLKRAVATSGNDTVITITGVSTDGSTALTSEVVDFGFFVSVDTNPTGNDMIVHNLDAQI